MQVSLWHKATTLALVVLVVEIGVLGLAWFVSRERSHPVEMSPYCQATNNEFTCTFTNLEWRRADGVCVIGTLIGQNGKAVESNSVCSGVVGPRESKQVSAPLRGNAKTACQDAEGLLDFSTCELNVAKH